MRQLLFSRPTQAILLFSSLLHPSRPQDASGDGNFQLVDQHVNAIVDL